MSAISKLSERFEDTGKGCVPPRGSFMEFLLKDARVKVPGGNYIPYSLEGREAMIPIIETIDHVLGSHTGEPLADATIDICGGAQFGKTVLSLNFGVYLTAVLGLNWGYYLPTGELVADIVDSKLRPDVIQQIAWLGPLMEVGKMEDSRGRAVNRKGAFQVSDGTRKAFGLIQGMNKVPTSLSADCVMEDEKDDIPPKNSKFLTGRMTSSDLRLRMSIGTQRLHSAGQQKQWEDGSQGIFVFDVGDGKQINLEDNWPQVCRLAVDGEPKPTDPKLTETGLFKDPQGGSWAYDPAARYYFADPETGAVVDRTKPILKFLRPERIKLRKWSFRISQFCIAAISTTQFVSRWQSAVADPDSMIVFNCDVKANPSNTDQTLTPEILKRAREAGQPFDLTITPGPFPRYAGLDTGTRCWLVSREVESPVVKRLHYAEMIHLSQMVARTEALFYKLGLSCLAIDANPAVSQAISLCHRLNKLEGIDWIPFQNRKPDARLVFPGGLVWDGAREKWENLKCFVVEFSVRQGGGVLHKLGVEAQGGFNKFYPVIRCNRFESIDRIVTEFLTPAEDIIRVVDGQLVNDPVMRLPKREAGSPPVVELLENHLITGSNRVTPDGGEAKDYVDKCENHFTLGDAYSALAEMEGGHGVIAAAFGYEPVEMDRRSGGRGGF